MNIVTDVLFQRDTEVGSTMAFLASSFDLLEEYRASAATDLALIMLKDQIEAGSLGEPWALVDGLVTYHTLFGPTFYHAHHKP